MTTTDASTIDGDVTPNGRPSLGTRLAAVWRLDVWPSLWGIAIWVALLLLAPYLLVLVLPIEIVEIDVMITSITETITAGLALAAVFAASAMAIGRRESLLGGWTRRERLEVLGVFAGASALVAAVLWVTIAALQPDPRGLIESATGATWINLTHPEPSLVAFLIVAAVVLAATFAPSLLVSLSRVNGLAVVGGSLVLAIVGSVLGVAYGMVAYPRLNVPADLYADVAGPHAVATTVVVSAGVIGAVGVVWWSAALALRAPVERFR